MNDTLFEKYSKAGRVRDKIVVIESQSDVKEIQYARKRCVFSMPEYVAGLQFDLVYVVHVDKAELGEEDTFGAKRRFLSKLYLGASRASKELVLASSKERGGANDVLEGSLRIGVLVGPEVQSQRVMGMCLMDKCTSFVFTRLNSDPDPAGGGIGAVGESGAPEVISPN